MSNIYRLAPHIQHYQMPVHLITKLSRLKTDDFRLLNFLHHEFQRTNKSALLLTPDFIYRGSGVYPTNLGKARKRLVTHGLLLVIRSGKNHVYTCCDPTDQTPVPDSKSTGVHINFDDLNADTLRDYFEPLLVNSKSTSNGLQASCPFHEDNNPSFTASLESGSGGVWRCFGCNRRGKLVEFEVCLSERSGGAAISPSAAHARVVERLRSLGALDGTTPKQDVIFPYYDEDGDLVSETVRPGGDKRKMFRRRPDPDNPVKRINDTRGCRKVLYRLDEVREAKTVIVVEGEPDVETLRHYRLQDIDCENVACTTAMGGSSNARQWKELAESLRDKVVILIGDNDDDGKGLQYMQEVNAHLRGKAKAIQHVVLPPEYRDVSHYLQSHPIAELVAFVGPEFLEPVEPYPLGLADGSSQITNISL